MWVFLLLWSGLVFVGGLVEEGIIKESLGYGCVPLPPYMGAKLMEDCRGIFGSAVSFL